MTPDNSDKAPVFLPLDTYREFPVDEMKRRSNHFFKLLSRRRSVRDFSNRPIPQEVIEKCLLAAGTAPSGANIQPWHFAVARSPELKRQIREAAEKEEHEFYTHRATREWLEDLAFVGTDENKPFLETAPYLIGVFSESYRIDDEGNRRKSYYVRESVGIATGMLITALHHAGLATLTHTPSPMGFLNELMNRPENEKPFLLLVVGYPAEDATVPHITKKPLEEISSFLH